MGVAFSATLDDDVVVQSESLILWVSALTAPCFGIVVLWLVLRVYRKRLGAAGEPLQLRDGALEVPLLAAFTGLRFLPRIIAIAHNNGTPAMVLRADHVEHKVAFTRRSSYEDIEQVDIFVTAGTRNLILRFRNTAFTFSANVFHEDKLRQVLGCFQLRGCRLSERALRFLRA